MISQVVQQVAADDAELLRGGGTTINRLHGKPDGGFVGDIEGDAGSGAGRVPAP
jgi:hypothetical protein